MRMTQPQHQYSKTATYIVSNVNCVYIYIYIHTINITYNVCGSFTVLLYSMLIVCIYIMLIVCIYILTMYVAVLLY